MFVSNPSSSEVLGAAGLLSADAVLLAAEESLRGSPSEADAQVLGSMVEVQHLLACNREFNNSQSGSSRGKGSFTSSSGGSRNMSRRATMSRRAGEEVLAVLERQEGEGGRERQLHVVACVATTAAKAVAAAFFGSPSTGGGGYSGGGAVVGEQLFTYELLVPGELESAVLVQVANEPLYVKVRPSCWTSCLGMYMLSHIQKTTRILFHLAVLCDSLGCGAYDTFCYITKSNNDNVWREGLIR